MNIPELPETTLVASLRAEHRGTLWLRSEAGRVGVHRVADQATEIARTARRTNTELRVVFTGARAWRDNGATTVVPILHAVLLGLIRGVGNAKNLRIIQGEAQGLDLLVRFWADRLGAYGQGFPILEEDRRIWGNNTAPLKRNERMIATGRGHVCIGVPHPKHASRGTHHCMRAAAAAGMPVYTLTFKDDMAAGANLVERPRPSDEG